LRVIRNNSNRPRCLNNDIVLKQASLIVGGEEHDFSLNSASIVGIEPNPFSGSANIRFFIPEKTTVEIKILDITGKLITTLMKSKQEQGEHVISMDGSKLTAGIYYCRMIAGESTTTKKLVIRD